MLLASTRSYSRTSLGSEARSYSRSSVSEEEGGHADPDSEDEDVLTHVYESLDANVYGWAVSMIVRNTVWLHQGTHLAAERVARVFSLTVLVCGTIGLQVFLLLAIWRLLCGEQVEHIRSKYSDYEALMYPNRTELTVNGFRRGVPGYRQDERFLLMDSGMAEEVCEIPLAHPYYLAAMLLVWTLTCQVEVRLAAEMSYRLLCATPTVKSLEMVLREEDGGEHRARLEGLTIPLKVFIMSFVQAPRIVTVVVLLWLGCRWLTATVGLGDVLLNGLALEFILVLKDLFYGVFASHRDRAETETLFTRPVRILTKPGCCTFFDSQVWGLASVVYVIGYVFYFQQVLPDYRWDVHDLCTAASLPPDSSIDAAVRHGGR